MVKIGSLVLDKKHPGIAVTISSVSPSLLEKARKAGADIVELRADKMRTLTSAVIIKNLKNIRTAGFPSILTIRSREEGGAKRITDGRRLELFKKTVKYADAVDIEFFSRDIRDKIVSLAHRHKKKAIVSFHAFYGTPSDFLLDKVLSLALKEGADIVKLSCMALDFDDMVKMVTFTYDHKNKNIITLSMGKIGRTSRVILPGMGSLMTYGFVDRPQAPGQMHAARIKMYLSALPVKNER